jgi:hypothetical protein
MVGNACQEYVTQGTIAAGRISVLAAGTVHPIVRGSGNVLLAAGMHVARDQRGSNRDRIEQVVDACKIWQILINPVCVCSVANLLTRRSAWVLLRKGKWIGGSADAYPRHPIRDGFD